MLKHSITRLVVGNEVDLALLNHLYLAGLSRTFALIRHRTCETQRNVLHGTFRHLVRSYLQFVFGLKPNLLWNCASFFDTLNAQSHPKRGRVLAKSLRRQAPWPTPRTGAQHKS
jgi:hypothetical protein